MFGIVAGEVMSAGKVLFGTHIYIIVSGVVQDGIQSDGGGDADGTGRKSGVQIGVVRRVGFQVGVGYSSQSEVLQGEFDGGVCLQGHTGVPGAASSQRYGKPELFLGKESSRLWQT